MPRLGINPKAKVELAELMEHARASGNRPINSMAIEAICERYHLIVDSSVDEVTEIMYQISQELPVNKQRS